MPTPSSSSGIPERSINSFIAAHNLDDLAGQHACPADCQFGLAGTLEDGEDDGIAFQENFLCAILPEQFCLPDRRNSG